jgi:H+/gluconate symporter-like permease
MGETLGFIAVVVGLGAIFGHILESSGGAHALADFLLNKFGQRRASWAMMFTGFIVAIPVFFDVGLIIFIPFFYALGRETGKSLLYYGIPLLAIWLLGIRRGMPRDRIMSLSTKALGPAGVIILVTGAGGVLKEVLVQSGIGTILADSVTGTALSPILLAWMIEAVVRLTQGSATVAMITAAGIVAPILPAFAISDPHRALIVIAISSGVTITSHVNDSGFWLVSKYFGMNEKQTLQSWTVMETIISLCGLTFALTASLLFR